MKAFEQLQKAFNEAAAGGWQLGADRLCRYCVELLGVDGASLSLWHRGEAWGTLGASSALGRRLDELQFTFGEGPCIDAVAQFKPVLVADLRSAAETRWPAFSAAVMEAEITAVFALPVGTGGLPIGALDLFRYEAGALTSDELVGGMLAAEAATVPIQELMREATEWDDAGGLAGRATGGSWERVEVYQATGMIMSQLDVGQAEAFVRLRGYAFMHGMTASEVAVEIIERRLVLDNDAVGGGTGGVGRE